MAQYTKDDVMAAHFADWVNMNSGVQGSSVEGELAQSASDSNTTVEAETSRYRRGMELLDAGLRPVGSDRFCAPDGEGKVALKHLRERHELLSDPVMVLAGHIAQSTAYRYIALTRRKQGDPLPARPHR
jgi:hypothetical protein